MSAILSDCGIYRYVLTRRIPTPLRWVRPVLFVMLNPSTADAEEDDNTIRKCVKFATREGGTILTVVNLFAFRSKEPEDLRTAEDPIGPENDRYIAEEMHRHRNCLVVAAWGVDKFSIQRGRQLRAQYPGGFKALRISKAGHPWHPLYLPDNEPLVDLP